MIAFVIMFVYLATAGFVMLHVVSLFGFGLLLFSKRWRIVGALTMIIAGAPILYVFLTPKRIARIRSSISTERPQRMTSAPHDVITRPRDVSVRTPGQPPAMIYEGFESTRKPPTMHYDVHRTTP